MTVTQAKFEELVDDLVTRCRKPVEKALSDAGLSPSDIDEVVLVGGSTRVPKVREMVQAIFGKAPHQGVNPDEVVALGARNSREACLPEIVRMFFAGRHSAYTWH